MSTSPNVPSLVTNNSPTLITKVEHDLTYLKTHVLLALGVVVVVGALVLGSVYGVESIIAKVRGDADARATMQLQAVQATQKSLEDRLTAGEAASAQREAVYLATIQQLAASQVARDKQATVDKQKAATLNAIDTAAAIAQRTKAAPGEVTATGDLVTMDLPISRQVNQDLISLDQTRADLKDTQGQLSATSGQLGDCKVNLQDANAVITGDKVVLAAQIKKDGEDLKVVKDEARKSKMKWFFRGVIVGTIFGAVAGKKMGI